MRRTPFTCGIPAIAALLSGCTGDPPGKGPGNGTDGPDIDQIWINEVMASNTFTLQDAFGAYPDWIELYNPNDHDVDVGGWWLTDDLDRPLRSRIPAGIVIPASGFLVFFADGEPEKGELHLNFRLDADGYEDVGLFGPEAVAYPQVDGIEEMGLQVSDVSIARIPDGGPTWNIEADPTPGASNGS